MIRSTSYAALALFLTLAPASLMAQNAPSSDPAQLPDATEKVTPPKPIEGQIILQDKGTFLASGLIGAPVMSPDKQDVGDINDIIVKPDGAVQGVVIGVGGFLGIGEKDVAVAMNRLTITPSPDDPRGLTLVLNATKDELAAAPAFKTAYMQKLEEDEAKRQAEQLTTQTGQDSNALQVPEEPKPVTPQQ